MKSVLRYVSVVSISALLFSACSFGADEEAKETVKDAMKNTQNIESGEYSYSISAEAINSDLGGSFSVSMSGAFDSRDFDNLLFSMDFEGTLEEPDSFVSEQSLAAEVRVVDNTAYGMLSAAPEMAAFLDPEFDSKYVGKWFSLPIPQEVLDELERYDALSSEEKEESLDLSEEEQKIKDLILNADYIEGASKEGSEDGMDKYSVDLDEEAIVQLAVDLSNLDGYEPSEEEKQNLTKVLDDFSENLSVWIDPSTNMATRFVGEFEVAIDPEDESAGSVLMTIDLGVTNVNGEVSIEVPEGAEAFDVGGLLGLPLGL